MGNRGSRCVGYIKGAATSTLDQSGNEPLIKLASNPNSQHQTIQLQLINPDSQEYMDRDREDGLDPAQVYYIPFSSHCRASREGLESYRDHLHPQTSPPLNINISNSYNEEVPDHYDKHVKFCTRRPTSKSNKPREAN
jgi:hypothetical protein